MRRKSYWATEHNDNDAPEFLRVEIIAETLDKAGDTINARIVRWIGGASGNVWEVDTVGGVFVYRIDGEDPTTGDRVWVTWCGDTSHWEQVSGGSSKKWKCRFTLDAALATTDASVAATITHQYGSGSDHSSTSITVYNFLTHTAGTHTYEGDSGDAGTAYYDPETDKWYIDFVECP